MSGFFEKKVKIIDLKTNKEEDFIKGYGSTNIIDENKYITFSSVAGYGIENKDDMIESNGKEYLAGNEVDQSLTLGEVKSKKYENGILKVDCTLEWGGEPLDYIVEFVQQNGSIKINKIADK